MSDLDADERKMVPLAIRGWLDIGCTEKEKRMLVMGVLSVGMLGEDMDQAIALAEKLGIIDLVETEVKRLEAAAALRGKPCSHT